MIMKKTFTILLLIYLLTCWWLSQPGFTAFDVSGWGARPTGMGGAFTAISDDVNAIFFNPAGTAQLNHIEGIFMHCIPYLGLDLKVWDDVAFNFRDIGLGMNYFAAAYPAGKIGTFGIGWTSLSASGLYSENTISINYAKKVISSKKEDRKRDWQYNRDLDLYAGLNLKYLFHSYILDDRTQNDPVFGGDGSLTYDTGFTAELGCLAVIRQDISVGLMIKNLIPANIGLTEKEILYPEIRLGGAYKVNNFVTPAVDISYRFGVPVSQRFNFNLGCEAWFSDRTLGIRTGLNLDEIGIGFSYRKLMETFGGRVDYSFNYPFRISSTLGTHRISLVFQYGKELGVEDVKQLRNLDSRNQKTIMKQYYEQGVKYFKNGDYGRAIKEFRKVLIINPNNKQAMDLIEKAKNKMNE